MNEQTKLRALPRRQRIIRRPRLTRLLDEAAERCRVLMLIAPAGYGKTTLAREWVQQRPRRFGWYGARPASLDVAAVAVDLATAAAEIVPGGDRRLRERMSTTASPEDEVPVLAGLLASDLEQWPEDAWLVIDDYQLIRGSASAFVLDVIERSPLNLLLASRLEPSWVNSRRLIHGEIFALNYRALAMTRAEIRALVGEQRSDEISLLSSLSEGWPAVVGLAAVTESGLPHWLPERLYDYLAEEVMNGLTPATQSALLHLAIAGKIDPIAHQVLGSATVATAVGELKRSGLLEVAGGREPKLHPLMQAFLKRKLADLPPDVLRERVESLIDAYIARRHWDEAFLLISDFNHTSRLPDLIRASLYDVLAGGRLPTVEQWLAAAGANAFDHPLLDLAAAEVANRKGQHARGSMLAVRAADQLGDDSMFLCHAYRAAAHATHFGGASAKDALPYARAALDHAPDEEALRQALWELLILQSESEQPEAATTLERLTEMRPRSEAHMVSSLNAQLVYYVRFGDIAPVVERARAGLALLPAVTNPLLRTSFRHNLAHAHCAAGNYEEALALLDELLYEARDYRLNFITPHARGLQIEAEIGLRNWTRARRLAIENLRAAPDDPHVAAHAHGALARISLYEGDHLGALRLISEAPDPLVPGTLGELTTYAAITEAARGALVVARDLAERAERISRTHEVAVPARCVVAFCALESGATTATEALATAMAAVEDSGHLSRFTAAYRALPRLLRDAAENTIWTDILEQAILKGRDGPLARRVGIRLRSGGGPNALTPREQEVLELIARGKTNEQIARDLSISLATAKVHVRHILAKLGVKTRTQAALQIGRADEVKR